jgi:1,4-alpha-glucan branching enzyme
MDYPKGHFVLLLHAHLPFIRHPEHEEFLQENWFFEALDETYYPLLSMFERLEQDRVPYSLCISLSPPLCEMFVDPLLRERYVQRLERIEHLLIREAERVRGTDLDPVVTMYRERLAANQALLARWANPLEGFRYFQECGHLELITCPGTHPILPLCATDNGKRAHIKVAMKNHEKHLGRRPKGMWLSECAYEPGIDALLAEQGIEFFFVDTNGILFASPRPRYGVHAPVSCANGVVAFGRDFETGHKICCSEAGYSKDPAYREYCRDLGFDAEYCYIRPFLQQDGIRRNVGLKYHRISGDVPLEEKCVYQPSVARLRADEHAEGFLSTIRAQMQRLAKEVGQQPVVVAPYDAELFGHWWFEGTTFLEMLFRKMAYDQEEVKSAKPSHYLGLSQKIQIVQPAQSTWGSGGYLDVWLNKRNDWIYRHLHKAEERMVELARLYPDADGVLRRALNQAARELLVAQSSDWAFIMNAGTAIEYAEKRTRDHIHNLNGIYLQVVEDRLENGWIAELEARNTIFQEMDYRVFL